MMKSFPFKKIKVFLEIYYVPKKQLNTEKEHTLSTYQTYLRLG